MLIELLPARNFVVGPITKKRLIRLLIGYGLIYAAGLACFLTSSDLHGKVFGMGVIFPGAGFLAYANFSSSMGLLHVVLAVIALVFFCLSLVIWFATGNVLAPPLTWLGLAVASAMMNHGVIPVGVTDILWATFFIVLLIFTCSYIWHWRASGLRKEANGYLEEQGAILAKGFKSASPQISNELSLHELKLQRFILDRALQPVDEFSGFEWLDQFQTAAVRYQINFMGYALSMAQANQLPALGGYLDLAQKRLIEKQTNHRVWRYWGIENAWGNLSCDKDPIARENIMYSGFCALQMAMYHASSSLRCFDKAHSFSLKHPKGDVFSYDFSSLVATLEREYLKSDFHLIACEPNWIYPLCNTIGASAVKACDSMNGGNRWVTNEAIFRQRLEEEFIDLSGRFVPCRSNYTGIALPILGGCMPQAMPCLFLNAIAPDLALRQWLLLRRSIMDFLSKTPQLNLKRFWRIDTGNYRFTRAAALAGTALAANEMGDTEIANMCFSVLDEECPVHEQGDSWCRPKASVWAHAVELFARSSRANGFRQLIEFPRQKGLNKPYISYVNYPEVLVAKAVHDESMLNAVLYSLDKPNIQRIELSGLIPTSKYICHGVQESNIIADEHGKSVVYLNVNGRSEMLIQRAY